MMVRSISLGTLLLKILCSISAVLLTLEVAAATSVGFSPPLKVAPSRIWGGLLPSATSRPREYALLGPSCLSLSRLRASADLAGGSVEAAEPPQKMAAYIGTRGLEASFFKAGEGCSAQVATDSQIKLF